MTESVEINPKRPAEGWKYPYVAGAIDFGGSIAVNVAKASDRKVGYVIVPAIRISKNNPTVIGFLEEFCEEHGLNPIYRDETNTFRVEISKWKDIATFLKLIQPYLIVRHEVVTLIVEDLLPGLEAGKGSTKEGFVELMGYVDEIRTHTRSENPKYDQDHFREIWEV